MSFSTQSIKQLNKKLILNQLKSLELGTKISLSTATGLSIATCGNLLKELVASGQVIEVEVGPSTGGRPSRQFKYNKDYRLLASIYPRKEGKSPRIFYNITNLLGEIIDSSQIECDLNIIKELDELLHMLVGKYPKISGLSLGVPGVVENGIIGVCDFDALIGFPIVDYFTHKYHLKVIAENDVNSAAYGYYHQHNPNGQEVLCYIYFPIGGNPGSGIILNGEILNGNSNFAGEVSYMACGYDRYQQCESQQNHDAFCDFITTIIVNINCVINPKTIILSGYCLDQQDIVAIREKITTLIPKPHIPAIVFEEDLNESYQAGLIHKGLELLD